MLNPLTALTSIKKAGIFGAGESGICALKVLTTYGIEVTAFYDNSPDKIGTTINGIPVCTPKYIERDKIFIFICSDWARDIALQLVEYGHTSYTYFGFADDFMRWKDHFNTLLIQSNNDLIRSTRSLLENNSKQLLDRILEFRQTGDPSKLLTSNYPQYFNPMVQPKPGMTIIDGGAWHGDTVSAFSRHCRNDILIYAFEPDEKNFNILKAKGFKNVSLFNMGLWSHKDRLGLNINPQKDSRSMLTKTGEPCVDVISIDEFVRSLDIIPDLIKLDIEGAEPQAVRGAANTIKKFHPLLQISVYHNPDDLWTIPIMIRDIEPNYIFFMGHHTQNLLETILYAMPS